MLRDVEEKLRAEQKAQAEYNLNPAQRGSQAPGGGEQWGYVGSPKTTEEKIADIFTFHDDPSKGPNYGAIRSTAKHFAEVICANSPSGQDQSLAILYLRQAVMFANAAIALNGRQF
jgi:hypothetical protein